MMRHHTVGRPRTPIPHFDAAPDLLGHTIQRSDVHRTLLIDGNALIHFSEREYRLVTLLFQCFQHYMSYTDLVQQVYGCDLDEYLLMTLRKRISSIRGKIAGCGLDIICVINRGYQIQQFPAHLHKEKERAHR
jgi:DNA-binding response OmpR family regulator